MRNILKDNQMIYSISEFKDMNLSHYMINKLIDRGSLKKLNRKYYENLEYKGDFNEIVYVNAYITRGVICLISVASYYELTSVRPQCIDIAIHKKDKVHTLPDWTHVSLYYYSNKRHETGVKQIHVNDDIFYFMT